MKQLILLFSLILFSISYTLTAQQIVTLNSDGTVTPNVSEDKQDSFVFIVDKKFKGKKFEVFSPDGKNPVSLKGALLGGNLLSKNVDDDNYTITIQSDHKVKGCDDDCYNIPDDFSIKLDGENIGIFHLLPLLPKKTASSTNPANQIAKAETEYKGEGSLIDDANFFAANIEKKQKGSTILAILKKKYTITNAAQLRENNFLKNELAYTFSVPEGKLNIKSLAGSIGGLDVTNIADGLAKFLVKRTKQELTITFFERFKKDLEKNPDLKSVFPTTYNLLMAIDTQIYNYTNYIENLREAFRSDIKVLDENLPSLVNNHKEFFIKKNRYTLAIGLKTGCYIATSLKHGAHTGDIIDGYPISFFDSIPDQEKAKLTLLKGSIQSLQLLNESLRESDTLAKNYWVGVSKVRQLVNDKVALKIYLGLMLQVAKERYDNIKFNETDSFYTKLNTPEAANSYDKDYGTYKEYILTFGNKVNELNKMIKEYEKPASDSLKVEQYALYFKRSVEFVQYCVQVTKLPYINTIPEIKNLDSKTKRFFIIGYETADLTTAINRKKYSEAINHLIVIYNEVLAKPSVEEPDTKTMKPDLSKDEKILLADAVLTKNATDSNAKISTVIQQVPELQANEKEATDDTTNYYTNTLASLAKYGAFMANMVKAKNSDEVEEAIESVALPVGSSRIKRETPFNISVNAYCGLFIGHEKIKGIDDNHLFNSYGLTAPIGIAISKGNRAFPWPLNCSTKDSWSSSWFISLIDIGSIAAYRFANDTTSEVPTIQLKDIISPGLFWSVGIPKTPLSLNFGAQVGPNLRKVNDTANDYSGSMYFRYSAAIVIDIPLLNLYTKNK